VEVLERGGEVEGHGGSTRPVQLDGEVTGTTPFDASVAPRALALLVDPAAVPGGVRTDA